MSKNEEVGFASALRAEPRATYEELRAAYDLKVQELAAETLRTSKLINAIHDAHHNSWDPPMDPWCSLCRVLRELKIPDRTTAVGTAGGGQPNGSDLGSVETQKGNTE